MSHFQTKIEGIFIRLTDMVLLLPKRAMRVGRHIWLGLNFLNKSGFHFKQIGPWSVDLVFLLIELSGLPELLEILLDLVKWKCRALCAEELNLVKAYFGNSLRTRTIRIDEHSWISFRKRKFWFVLFNTINGRGKIAPDIFIHEMVHIWQYQNVGAAYIPRALRAQRSKRRYNYGGARMLQMLQRKGRGLHHLNAEQQADFVQDHYRLSSGLPPIWGDGDAAQLPVYEYFLAFFRRTD